MASTKQRIGYLGPEGTFTQQALRSQAATQVREEALVAFVVGAGFAALDVF